VFALSRIDGWGFDVEILYLFNRFGWKVAEVPGAVGTPARLEGTAAGLSQGAGRRRPSAAGPPGKPPVKVTVGDTEVGTGETPAARPETQARWYGHATVIIAYLLLALSSTAACGRESSRTAMVT